MKKTLTILTALYCVGYLGILTLIGLTTGMTLQGQLGDPMLLLMLLRLLSFCCSWGLILTGLMYLLYLLCKRRAVLLPVAILAVVLPFLTHKYSATLFYHFQSMSECREIRSMDSDLLRSESGELVQGLSEMTTDFGYFGKRINTNQMSTALLAFTKGEQVEVTPDGIVYQTHGLGSWRAGYMITPSDSDHEPDAVRKIMDGFFYVVSQ